MTSRTHPNAGLSPVQVDELERALLERERELIESAKRQDSLLEADDRPGDAVDRAEEERRYRDAAVLGNAQRDELEAIEHALDRLRQGTYGVSEISGGPLGIERLRALPYADRTAAEAEQRRDR